MIIEISVALIAVTFLLLVFFIIRTLRSVRESLEETEKLLQSSNLLIHDIHTKLKSLDPIITSTSQVGDAISQIATSAKRISKTISQSTQEIQHAVHTHQRNISDVMEWASTGWNLWNRFQAHRNAKQQGEGAEGNG